MSRCCLQYLVLPELALRNLPFFSSKRSPLRLSKRFPLLEYAACYWPDHFKKQSDIAKRNWAQQASRLCKVSEQRFEVWSRIYCQQTGHELSLGWTDLAVAAHLGISTVVDEMLDDEAIDVNEECCNYGSALMQAIDSNEDVIAEPLIARGANVHASSLQFAPLLLAAMKQNKHMISLLLENGASLLEEVNFRIPSTPRTLRTPTTVLQYAAHDSRGAFYKLVSAVVDISTPDKVMAALTHEIIGHCGNEGLAKLFYLVPDEKLGDVTVLTQDNLQTLLGDDLTHSKALLLIVKQNRQNLLTEPLFLSIAVCHPESRQIVRSILQEHGVPCATIQQDVLQECVAYGDAETLKTLIQYCPEEICDVKGLLRVVGSNTQDPVAMSELVMNIAGETLSCDQQLQEELLNREDDTGIVYTFLQLPRFTLQVARRLVQIILRRWESTFPLDLEAEKDMVARILDRCTDKSNVINATLLTDAARHRDRETVLWLLELSGGGLVTKERLLEAAAANITYGKVTIEALLQDEGAATVITPCAVLAAAVNGGKKHLNWLMRKQASKVARTAGLKANADRPQALETLAVYGDRQVAELALLALRMAAEDRSHLFWVMKDLIPHCAGSLIKPTEDFILGSLEGDIWQVEQVFLMLVATVGNGMVLTERILARVASCHQLLEMVRDWRPSELKVTPSLIAMIAAGGHTESLDYLAKCDDELTIGAEWYRLARLRSLIEDYDSPITMDDLKALWEEGYIPDVTDANGMTALHAAAGSDWASQSIPFLVDVAKFSADAVDRSGWTALHHAVRNGSLKTVQALVLAGADPHKADYQGRTPVTMAQGCETCKMVGRTDPRFELMEPEEVLAVLNGDFRAVNASGRGRRGSYWSL